MTWAFAPHNCPAMRVKFFTHTQRLKNSGKKGTFWDTTGLTLVTHLEAAPHTSTLPVQLHEPTAPAMCVFSTPSGN